MPGYSDHHWLKQTPPWVWLSLIPVFGGLAITYAGYQAKIPTWLWLGTGLTIGSLLLHSYSIALLIWIAQIVIAFSLRKKFLLKTASKGIAIPDLETAQFLAEHRGKIDINNCSKHDLVYELGLPIVYANNIDSVRNEGYLFTHIEELSELAGIPENYLKKLEPLIVFSYDINKESEFSWRRFNQSSISELILSGFSQTTAHKIIEERYRNGDYKSLIDVKSRTGISLKTIFNPQDTK